ncbi:hypothetical protein [Jannaschia formosa]|uniref:hypothetical protein n=1 Tax=Jannaschia formosa TaxID=2259592 RepID=UPI001074AFCE|nr:hypothetical protein [Jannaschia formosa]TFL18460.1 hypothetical protein DR046_10235 [Jannaschia formosa]
MTRMTGNNNKTYFRPPILPSRAMRPIPKSSRAHFVGETTFWRDGCWQVLGFGSLLEYRAAILAFAQPNFHDLEEQIGPIALRLPNGKTKKHFLDYRLTTIYGQRIGLSVKPYRRATRSDFKAEMKALRHAGTPAFFDRLCVVTERNQDPVRLANAHLFHDAREAEPDLDADVLAELLRGPRTVCISEAVRRSDYGGRSFFPIVRNIRAGNLSVPPRARIGGETMLEVAA